VELTFKGKGMDACTSGEGGEGGKNLLFRDMGAYPYRGWLTRTGGGLVMRRKGGEERGGATLARRRGGWCAVSHYWRASNHLGERGDTCLQGLGWEGENWRGYRRAKGEGTERVFGGVGRSKGSNASLSSSCQRRYDRAKGKEYYRQFSVGKERNRARFEKVAKPATKEGPRLSSFTRFAGRISKKFTRSLPFWGSALTHEEGGITAARSAAID